ncbi:MAG: hormogonium polysaccharide biosynthesis protein HpsL [Microcystaceae cyanobacterium]
MVRTAPQQPFSTEADKKQLIKEKIAQKRQAKAAKQKLNTVIGLCIFAAIVFGGPAIVTLGPKFGILIGLGISVLLFSYSYPRMALWLFLIYMPFSGTVTYSVGAGSAIFQLSKDAFFIPAFLGLLQDCYKKGKKLIVSKPLMVTFIILCGSALLTLLIVNGSKQLAPYCRDLNEYNQWLRDSSGNIIIRHGVPQGRPCRDPNEIPFLQGVLGLKVLVGYVPLIFCGFYLIKDKKTLLFLGRLLVVLAIVCCVLGLIQFAMLKTGRCKGTIAEGENLFRASLRAKCLVGGSLLYSPSQNQIRLPGTFVSPWHWGWFLLANSAICFSVAFGDSSLLWRGVGLGGIALVFMNAVVCGQRLAFLGVPAIVLIMAILTGQILQIKRFIPAALGLGILSFVGFSFVNPDFIQQRIDSFVSRWNQSPPHKFFLNQFEFATKYMELLGHGSGVATNSTRIFGDVTLIETFHPKIIHEIGLLGFTAFMVFATHIVIVTFKKYRSLQDTTLSNFASGFWVFVLIISYMPYWYPLDTDPVCVYYWLFIGVLLKLPIIDQQEQERKVMQSETVSV